MERESFDEEFGPDEPPLPNNRRGARQVALQALYWDAVLPGNAEFALQELGRRSALSPGILDFATRLVRSVGEHQAQLDELIAEAATRWPQERLARLDHLILRLALAEILYFDDVPVRVSLDEAVELAKIYSTGSSYAFINGILDAIVRRQGIAI